jgi:hypothetical protein
MSRENSSLLGMKKEARERAGEDNWDGKRKNRDHPRTRNPAQMEPRPDFSHDSSWVVRYPAPAHAALSDSRMAIH